MKILVSAFLFAATPAVAQAQPAPALAGTRLDIVATGQASRVADLARISAGVVSDAPTASAAMAENARRMVAVRAALRRAGVEDRDIATSAFSLSPQYRQDSRPDSAQRIIGYEASNELSIRFRDVAAAGPILDALVAEGANRINGPEMEVSKPEEALDEARTKAITAARARADLYARAVGKRVARILTIDEGGGGGVYPDRNMGIVAEGLGRLPTRIQPGEQALSVTITVSFELE